MAEPSTPLVIRATRAYGAHPGQLFLVLVGFAIAGLSLRTLGFSALWNTEVWWQSISLWFVGAAVVHDVVLFPAYATADRLVVIAARRSTSRRPTRVSIVNFVRLPLMTCALITLMFLPGIIRQGADTYARATGQTQEPFLLRWLVLCTVICLLSLAAYLTAYLTACRTACRTAYHRASVAHRTRGTTGTKEPVSPAQPLPDSLRTHRSLRASTTATVSMPPATTSSSRTPGQGHRGLWAILAVAVLAAAIALVANRRSRR